MIYDIESLPILDLNQKIMDACGPPGFRYGAGGVVKLDKGVFRIKQAPVIGAGLTTNVRPYLRIEGETWGGMAVMPERFPMGGTTIVWDGPAHQSSMFNINGACGLELRNLHLDMKGVEVGLRISANNRTGANTHFVKVENVSIDGGGEGLGIHLTGEYFNDQVDFVSMKNISLRNLHTAYMQDSQQSALVKLENVDAAVHSRGFVIKDGQFEGHKLYIGSWRAYNEPDNPDGDFIGVHFKNNENRAFQAFQTSLLQGCHFEVSRGRMIVTEGFSPYTLTTIGNTFNVQRQVPGDMLVMDSSHPGMLAMVGDQITRSSPANPPPGAIIRRTGQFEKLGVAAVRGMPLRWQTN